MEADISTLYTSGFYQVLDFKCRCTDCVTSKPEFVDTFSISFIRKGNFLFNVFRNSFDSHTGRILLTKPGYEHTVTHIHNIPDECTIIDFTKEFYSSIKTYYNNNSFFSDNDLHSIQINTTPETEYLHHQLLTILFSPNIQRLQIDILIMEIIKKTLGKHIITLQDSLDYRLKKNHLITVEMAKNYIMTHFADDISLTAIADKCFVSPFHFSRIFKAFTNTSPHSFLLSVRLKNAELLLKTSTRPISDIAFSSGFNSSEHFSTTFTARYGYSPTNFRELWHTE